MICCRKSALNAECPTGNDQQKEAGLANATITLSLSLFIPVLQRDCYSTPCNVTVFLTGWMKSVTVEAVQVGVYFL